MINGLVLFAKTGGTTKALEDIVRPVAYHQCGGNVRRMGLFGNISTGDIPNCMVCEQLSDINMAFSLTDGRTGIKASSDIDIIHGSLPTKAEYARIIKRELGEESRHNSKGGVCGGEDGDTAKPNDLYGEIYELAKEIQPKFLFFEIEHGSTRDLATDFAVKLGDWLGYDCRWDTLSAYDVGSPQKRERVYLLARKRERDSDDDSRSFTTTHKWDDNRIEYYGESNIVYGDYLLVERTPERVAEVKAGLDEVCVPQYREAFLRLIGHKRD